MLAQISIRDIVLIDRLDLPFGSGLSALTGETGAGKSILLDALSLALGARGDASLVRHGQAQGQVVAAFDLAISHPARQVAKDAELETEGDLILRRVQYADGRTRAFVNDQPVSAQVMRAIGEALVEIHGQHDDRALTDASSHRALTDAFGGLTAQVATIRAAFKSWRGAESAVTEATEKLEAVRREAEYLRHSVAELNKLKPEEGEETTLANRRTTMMQSEKIASDLADAAEALGGSSSGVPALTGAWRRLERRMAQAPSVIEPIVKAFGEALDRLEETRVEVEAARRATDFDPKEMEAIEERLFALRAAARKYGTSVDALAAKAKGFAEDLAALDAGESRLASLMKQAKEAESAYAALAAKLSTARKATAENLCALVNAELPPLKLERAVFSAHFTEEKPGPEGTDGIEFWVQTNPGTRPGPMMKVASGGELSRFMLALKVVLADRGSAPTLVFDEIDTGVGGAVADAIGLRLARLSGKVQVLCVTHAPQVAAKATTQFLISKAMAGETVTTRVRALDESERSEELARMLAGETVTEEARAAARKLLQASA